MSSWKRCRVVDEFICSKCFLSFSVGCFHYGSGNCDYGSQNNLVCCKCGTKHYIRNAIRVDLSDDSYRRLAEEGLLPTVQYPDQMWSQPKPIFANIKDDIEFQAIDAPWIESARMFLADASSNIRGKEWAEGSEYPIWRLDQIECNSCQSRGSITAEWPKEGANCPYCNSLIIEPHSLDDMIPHMPHSTSDGRSQSSWLKTKTSSRVLLP